MTSALVASSPAKRALRDPVLVLPAVVCAGLVVGWLGARAEASGGRIALDLALAWSFVGASLLALGKERWRRSRILLTAAGFAVVVADIRWARSDGLWTLGFLLIGLWPALLAHFVLTFPEGRPWSRAAQAAIGVGYVAALGGQGIRALLLDEPRDVLSVSSQPAVAEEVGRAAAILGLAAAVALLFLVLLRVTALRGSARRAQAPLLAAAALAVPGTILWLAWITAAGEPAAGLEATARALALLIPGGLVASIVWSRLHRPEASELVVELSTEGAPTMRERLARALGDPTLDVAYRLDDGRYVDASGRTRSLPEEPDQAVTLVTAGGQEVAALIHDPALLDEPALVESVRATAGLVLENERLAAEVRSQLAEVRASRARIVAAADAERRRIERNLHDGAQQRLVTLSLTLGLQASRSDAADSAVLSRAQDEVEETIAELRELARGIHPTLLRDEGIDSAVDALARRMPVPVAVQGSSEGRLPETVELAAYFLVSEALANAAKHAAATRITVHLERKAGTLGVAIRDNGVGGARATDGSGLSGLRDRLAALDAALIVESERGRGTTIRTEISCGS